MSCEDAAATTPCAEPRPRVLPSEPSSGPRDTSSLPACNTARSGATWAVSIGAGLCIAEIGEFSFVLGAVGLDVGVVDAATFQVLTSASLFTLLAVPLLAAGRGRWASGLLASLARGRHQWNRSPRFVRATW